MRRLRESGVNLKADLSEYKVKRLQTAGGLPLPEVSVILRRLPKDLMVGSGLARTNSNKIQQCGKVIGGSGSSRQIQEEEVASAGGSGTGVFIILQNCNQYCTVF